MKDMPKESLTELNRSQTESADSQIREIKKLKLDEPPWFKKKANKDQFRFNTKLQDVKSAKSSVQSDGLQKVKNCLEKGETLFKERQKHILLADKLEFSWVTVHEYKESKIADDSEDEKKKLYKAELRAKAHAKQASARVTKTAVGAATRKNPFIIESNSKQFKERILVLRQIPTLDACYKTQVKPGFCYQCRKPGHWRAKCPTAL